jgi:hypothetical protein
VINYQEKSIPGTLTQYKRANSIIILNPLTGVPEVSFIEEIVQNLPDGTQLISPSGNLSAQMHDPSIVFNLISPTDGAIVGSMSYEQLYVAMYSLYFKLAQERDGNS